jgi:glycosyltransferase involved in cell wall biosynthesis
MTKLLLSIIIPAYNEEKYIEDVLGRVNNSLQNNSISAEIIVVDDASSDATVDKVNSYKAKHPHISIQLIESLPNKGKGFVIRQGIQAAIGDYILVQDADYEYDPRDYPTLLGPVIDGMADVVYGSRFMGGAPHRILFFWHSIGNKFLTFVSNMFTNLNLTDMESGYKLFRREIIQSLLLKENRFGFEPEVTAKIARVPGIRIYEVGISYYGRTYAEGKKINWKDGVRAIWCILKYNLFDRRHLK